MFEHVREPGEAIGGQGEADQAGGEAVEAEVAAPVQLIMIQIERGEPETETQMSDCQMAETETFIADNDNHIIWEYSQIFQRRLTLKRLGGSKTCKIVVSQTFSLTGDYLILS